MNIKKPNIVFVFTDQQRWDTVGCYGNKMDLTPNLDKMAGEGVMFRNAFTCQPLCGPARSCLQTGKYATETGCYINQIPIRKDEKTIAHIAKKAGYDVGYIGKWHLAATIDKPIPYELRGGYDDYWLAADALEGTSSPYAGKLFDMENNPVEFTQQYRVDALTDYTIEYMSARKTENPFFLFLSYLEPHHQNDLNRFVAPCGYADKYLNCDIPEDLMFEPSGDWKSSLPDYYGICKRIDENVGRILDKLNELGMRDNTVVIFTSDHGCHFKTRNSEYKRSCHESSIRIPLLIRGPGFEGGRIFDEIVSLIDLPPTILDVTGSDIPDYMKGKNLMSLIDGREENWPQEAFIQISEEQVARAIRSKRWKYGIHAPNKDGGKDDCSDVYREEYLYDLEKDPHEQKNLVGNTEYKDIREELREIIKKRMVQAGEKQPQIISFHV